MKFQIKDFCDIHCVEVEAHQHKDDRLVLLTQRGGSMSFQHSMRPDQARFMAASLAMAAEQAEKLAPVVDAEVKHLPSDDTEGGGL